MLIRVLLAALMIASIFAGVLSGASEGLPANALSDSPQSQSRNEINSPSL